jgi:RNA processing factor Prp31
VSSEWPCQTNQIPEPRTITFTALCREWYSWHFPELVQVVPDNYMFARVAYFIGNKSNLTDESVAGIEEIVGDEEKAQQVCVCVCGFFVG